MEPVSLSVGVFALAGLFNTAIDCFEYIQLGRNFGTNFQTSVLKLDNVQLRLSRWGQAVGLSGNIEDVQSLPQTAIAASAQEIPKAESTLGQILQLFADAEGVSAKFKSQAQPGDSSLLVHNTQVDLDPVIASFHRKMRELSIKRQNRTPLRQKAKWALYGEKQFRRLIEDVTDLVNDLVELFPAAQASQRELCNIEVSEIGMQENLPLLKDIATGQDKDLEAAISKVLEIRNPQTNTWNTYGNARVKLQVGQQEVSGNVNIY